MTDDIRLTTRSGNPVVAMRGRQQTVILYAPDTDHNPDDDDDECLDQVITLTADSAARLATWLATPPAPADAEPTP